MSDSKEPLHNYVRYGFQFLTFLYKRIWYFTDTCRESHFNILLSPFVLLKYILYTGAIFLTISNTLHVTQKLRYVDWKTLSMVVLTCTRWLVHSVTKLEITISSPIRLRNPEFSQLHFFSVWMWHMLSFEHLWVIRVTQNSNWLWFFHAVLVP